MFCENCGKEISDNSKFCEYCGCNISNEPVEETYQGEQSNQQTQEMYQGGQPNQQMRETYQSGQTNQTYQQNTSNKNFKKITGIIDIVAAAILLLVGFVDVHYDWGILSLSAGASILIAGVMQVIYVSTKTTGINRIIFGGITIVLSCFCAPEYDYENIGLYDWGYIGLIIGIALLVIGILGVTCKSLNPLSIVSIVAGGILILFGFSCIDYDWGITATVAGVAFLVNGILNLVNSKKQYD